MLAKNIHNISGMCALVVPLGWAIHNKMLNDKNGAGPPTSGNPSPRDAFRTRACPLRPIREVHSNF